VQVKSNKKKGSEEEVSRKWGAEVWSLMEQEGGVVWSLREHEGGVVLGLREQ